MSCWSGLVCFFVKFFGRFLFFNGTHFGGIKLDAIFLVILRDFHLKKSALFGLVIHHDPCFRKWGSIVSLNHSMH